MKPFIIISFYFLFCRIRKDIFTPNDTSLKLKRKKHTHTHAHAMSKTRARECPTDVCVWGRTKINYYHHPSEAR